MGELPDVLIQLGLIVLALCVLVSMLDGGGRKRERELRHQMIIDKWKREHPDAD